MPVLPAAHPVPLRSRVLRRVGRRPGVGPTYRTVAKVRRLHRDDHADDAGDPRDGPARSVEGSRIDRPGSCAPSGRPIAVSGSPPATPARPGAILDLGAASRDAWESAYDILRERGEDVEALLLAAAERADAWRAVSAANGLARQSADARERGDRAAAAELFHRAVEAHLAAFAALPPTAPIVENSFPWAARVLREAIGYAKWALPPLDLAGADVREMERAVDLLEGRGAPGPSSPRSDRPSVARRDLELEARRRRTIHLDPIARCEVYWRPDPPRCTCWVDELDPRCQSHGPQASR